MDSEQCLDSAIGASLKAVLGNVHRTVKGVEGCGAYGLCGVLFMKRLFSIGAEVVEGHVDCRDVLYKNRKRAGDGILSGVAPFSIFV